MSDKIIATKNPAVSRFGIRPVRKSKIEMTDRYKKLKKRKVIIMNIPKNKMSRIYLSIHDCLRILFLSEKYGLHKCLFPN